MPHPPVHHGHLDTLDARTLYGILALRSRVFVAEQYCTFIDPDDRDLDEDTTQLWVLDDDRVVATARLLGQPPDGGAPRTPSVELSRVVVDPTWRGTGLADHLVEAALRRTRGPVTANAQAGLARWYARHGFRVTGSLLWEDGIPHLPMRRDGLPGGHGVVTPSHVAE